MMTVHKLSAGEGFKYYTSEVATGDVLRDPNRALGDYYTVEGMPPGQWLGSGAASLALSGEVTEEQMGALFSGNALPITTHELSQLLASAPNQSEFIRHTVMEKARVEAAEKAWKIHVLLRQGKNQNEISEEISQEKKCAPRTVSYRLEQYKNAGNDFAKGTDERYFDASLLPELKREFIANYSMTEAESARARTTAEREVKAAKSLKSAAETPHTFETKTPFIKRLEEEHARFNRQNSREPNKGEKREILNRVGGQMFREEHRRSPRTNEEFTRWVASQRKPKQQTVAGFDLVFTPTKSVSIAWGLGDERLRRGIEAAHERAIADALTYLEDNAVYTRRGAAGIRQEETKSGLIATKFRHYDSREGDPNLHDHLVIANKVQGKDGRWLTLDGRMLYAHNVAASELYNSKIAEYIHADLGLEFVGNERKGRKIYELAGINPETINAFSSRRTQVKKTLAELEKKYIEEHGYAPNEKARIKLSQRATLATRPHKSEARSLAELHDVWTQSVSDKGLNLPTNEALLPHLQSASTQHAAAVIEGVSQALATSDMEHAANIIERLEQTRSTWKRTHIEAETLRYFRDVTSGPGVDETKFKNTVAATVEQSVALNDFAQDKHLPDNSLRSDGSSVYRRADAELFSSTGIYQAERNVVTAATSEKIIPAATNDLFDAQRDYLKAKGGLLSSTQEGMARAFVTDERLLVVGIGPAGAGKTTSMKVAVDTVHATGQRVFGLAPTAVAASVMKNELGIEASTIASFVGDNSLISSQVKSGDMILIDEIGMATTPDLAKILDTARDKGASVRGIGDYRQLSAIGSGGALRLIESKAGAIYLEDVFRFKNKEEAAASLALREPSLVGEDKPFSWYLDNGRITAGNKEGMVADVFAAYTADVADGKNSLMLAGTNEDVKALNVLGQNAAIAAGTVQESESKSVLLDDGTCAYVGDKVLTRKNNYQLKTNQGKDFVKNGDLWEIRAIAEDGALLLQHTNHRGMVGVPAEYAGEYVQLGYASTINRAQGSTVDTTHAVVDASTDRAAAYVALSRGRESNKLYVATDESTSRDDVLAAITANFDRNLSFHEETAAQRTAERNVATRLARYDDLATGAMESAMKNVVIKSIGEDAAQPIYTADGWGALANELAKTYRGGLDPEAVFTRAWQQNPLDDAEDIAAVLQWRVAGVRERDESLRERFGEDVRPLAHIPDESLEKLIETAKKRTTPLSEIEIEDKRWATRDYALVKTDRLREMLTTTNKALEANERTDPKTAAHITENMNLMQSEITRRRWSSPEQKHVEAIVRGEKPRSGHDFTILNALQWEKTVRDEVLVPTVETKDFKPERVTKGVSGYSLDSFWEYDRYTPESMQRVLKVEHAQVKDLVQLRGQQIAAEKPAWAQSLGEVPAHERNAKHWYRVAAEVEAFRQKYKVPDGDRQTVPKSLIRPGNRGDYLAQQVTEVHKRSRLSSTLKSSVENKLSASGTEMQVRAAEKPTQAEKLMGQRGIRQATPAKGENMQQVNNLWSQLEDAYRAEQQAKAQLASATEALAQSQASYRAAQQNAQARAEQLMQNMASDYAPVQQAQARVEDASFFTRGGRERELEAAQRAFAEKYGVTEVPGEGERSWMMNDPEYAAASRTVEDLGSQVKSTQADVDAVQGVFESAHARREDVYTDYAQVRDSNPETAIVSEDMTPAQVRELRSSRWRVDETLLGVGIRPDFAKISRSSGTFHEEENKQRHPVSVRDLQAQINQQKHEQQHEDSWDAELQTSRGLHR
ncbi:relaxase domain-containing protein (plasmid) [Rothia amarae]|uniref:Relaxase domain-containing protein n=1 Tax=Rothia amarae TaxID=169480 RepID=A0A7S6WXG3_9MICC|nr:MobF family relaxase [Rothia amarae]QOW64939.1 relaxase domain-containing protein [Rothia amarae]